MALTNLRSACVSRTASESALTDNLGPWSPAPLVPAGSSAAVPAVPAGRRATASMAATRSPKVCSSPSTSITVQGEGERGVKFRLGEGQGQGIRMMSQVWRMEMAA